MAQRGGPSGGVSGTTQYSLGPSGERLALNAALEVALGSPFDGHLAGLKLADGIRIEDGCNCRRCMVACMSSGGEQDASSPSSVPTIASWSWKQGLDGSIPNSRTSLGHLRDSSFDPLIELCHSHIHLVH